MTTKENILHGNEIIAEFLNVSTLSEDLLTLTIRWCHNGTNYSRTMPFPTETDDWFGHNVNDKLAFEINTFWQEPYDIEEEHLPDGVRPKPGCWMINIYVLDPNSKKDGKWTCDNFHEIGEPQPLIIATNLEYHNNWNALMTVVERITNMGNYFMIEGDESGFNCKIQCYKDHMVVKTIERFDNETPNFVLDSCIEFSEWYNEQ